MLPHTRLTAERVEAHHRRCFGQTITFGDGGTGDFAPALRHSAVQGGTACDRGLQMLGRVGQKPLLVEQAIEQGVHARHPSQRVVFDSALQVLHRAWAGHQNVVCADGQEAQQIGREREDVVQRQRGQHAFLAGAHVGRAHGQHLLHIAQQIAVADHGTLAHARGAPRCIEARPNRAAANLANSFGQAAGPKWRGPGPAPPAVAHGAPSLAAALCSKPFARRG